MIYLLAVPIGLAVLIAAACWLDWDGTLGPAWWLTLPARLVMPNTGHHRDKLRMTPAPAVVPGQAPRPADPPPANGAVRAGAIPTDAAPQPAPTGGAATLPQPSSGAPPVAAEDFPGLGQPPLWDAEALERILSGRPARQPWLYTVGYGPFERGPRAVIPSPRVSLRVTGGFPATGDAPAVWPYAEQWWRKWDEAVNEP